MSFYHFHVVLSRKTRIRFYFPGGCLENRPHSDYVLRDQYQCIIERQCGISMVAIICKLLVPGCAATHMGQIGTQNVALHLPTIIKP